MTPGELKFAMILEDKLNSLPSPEYRQLVVEALMMFSLVAKSSNQPSLSNGPLLVENIIKAAQQLFFEDQVKKLQIIIKDSCRAHCHTESLCMIMKCTTMQKCDFDCVQNRALRHIILRLAFFSWSG